jgi:hopanoid biosynthesis associated radical SAM protein HpnH
MKFSRELSTSLTGYLFNKTIRGQKRYPLVLMLEPLFRCNLRCSGCGRIRENQDILDKTMTLQECLAAVDEAGAPVVSITGGEPLLHPGIGEIVKNVIERKHFVNLCTNGQVLESSLKLFKPDPHLYFVLHMDGLSESHDKLAGKSGVFDTALSAIKAARKSGFQVLINTTLYKQSRPGEIGELFSLLAGIPVNGILVAPAFSYEAVGEDSFLSRQEMFQTFRPLYEMRRKVPFYNTPLYLEFLAGRVNLECKPWSTPTRNPRGWKKPCYLLTDGYYQSFTELMSRTEWDKYGAGHDPRCANCMVHCGYEASSISAIKSSLPNLWKTVQGIYN